MNAARLLIGYALVASWFTAGFAVGLAGTAVADEPHIALPKLFSRRAPLRVDEAGLQALSVPVALVEACRPGLSDLRMWVDGHEVPYLVDSTGADDWQLAEKIDLKPSHIRVDRSNLSCSPSPAIGDAPTHCVEMEVKTTPRWEGGELVFELAGARFIERVDLTLETPEHAPLHVRDQTIYRLQDGPGEQLRVPLPTVAHAGKLTILLQGEGPQPTPKLRLERGQTVRGSENLETPLAITSRWHDRAGTHLIIDRPLGILPTALRLGTRTGVFDRMVRIYDGNGGDGRRLVGEGRALRVSLPAGGARVTIDQVDVPLGVPRSKKLELVIDDGDSPALAELTVRAILRRPILVFDRDATGDVQLLFGGGRVDAPRYDLQSLLPDSGGSEGVRAEIAARLRARQGLKHPTLGAIEANPEFDPTPVLSGVAHPGAPVDATHFAHARTLHVVASADGLSRYVLTPADLAAARPDLGDLRLVDESGKQWPYVIDREVDPVFADIAVRRGGSKDGSTRYDLDLPASPLPLQELLLDVQEGFFSRSVVVLTRDEAGRETAQPSQSLARAFGNKAPISVSLAEPLVKGLSLSVSDGGDAPLTISAARGRMPTAALYVAARPGTYHLLSGDPDEEPASYELRSLSGYLAQLEAADVTADKLVDNPNFSASSRLRSGNARERVLVWAVLGLAVLVLGGLTLRMARGEPSAS
jgi:hypothetical protein